MPRLQALVVLFTLAAASTVSAQVLDDELVPRGRTRFELSPVFTSWESRFGRTAAGATGREDLGADLTGASAHALFPGAESLRAAVAAMSANAGYSPFIGPSQARVTHDITRVEFGAHVGVFDWLTIGVVLPWTRTRTSLDLHFRPDTLAGDLGRNPTATNAVGVNTFLQALGAAETAAQTNAAQICGGAPGSGTCTNAQALANRTTSFRSSAASAYGAAGFFPVATTTTATALTQSLSALSADLIGAGLGGIGVPMPFATQFLTEEELWTLPTRPDAGLSGTPLGSVKGLWQAGDVEVSATARILEGSLGATPNGPPRLTFRLLATALARLPTGSTDSADVFLDVGTGDGQADLEGRLLGQVGLGSRLGLHLGARYGIQRPRTLQRRVAAPELVLAPANTRHLVEWSPGSYFGLEVAPTWRLTSELSIAGEYRAFRKYRDEYELTGAPDDPTVLELESGVTLHEVGGTIRYDTMARWLGEGARPIQANFRFTRAVAGGGGQTPVTTQVEFGVRLFRRLWGRS